MATINNPQAVRFCNERVRVAANHFSRLYAWCKSVSNEWTAQGMGTLIPNSADQVADGAATDGRPIITGSDVNVMAARVTEFINLMEATSNQKLNQILKVAPDSTG